MAFRIDSICKVSIDNDIRWQISFSLLDPPAKSLTYYSGRDGRFLFAYEGVSFKRVVNSDRVYVPLEMLQDAVTTIVATWMKLQGWGREFDHSLRSVRRSVATIVDPQYTSDDKLLQFDPFFLQLVGWEEGTELNVELDGDTLVITHAQSKLP